MGDLIQIGHRPKKRGDCIDAGRPCPFVSCRYHLGHELVLGMNGSTADEIADAVLAMPHTCALDVADAGEQTVTRVGEVMGVSRERGRQIFKRACIKVGADPKAIWRIEQDRMNAACKAYIHGDPVAAAAEFGYETGRLRELASKRFPDESAAKRKRRIDRTREEKIELVMSAQEYPSLEQAAKALGVAPASLRNWARGKQLGTHGGRRSRAGRKGK